MRKPLAEGYRPAPKKPPGRLRKIVKHLTRVSSALEPVTVLLECGHTTRSGQTAKRARCPACLNDEGLRQAQARLGREVLARGLVQGQDAIFSAVRRFKGTVGEGYRVMELDLVERTPGFRRKRVVLYGLRVCCDARAVELVKKEMLEMGKRLDGLVVVT